MIILLGLPIPGSGKTFVSSKPHSQSYNKSIPVNAGAASTAAAILASANAEAARKKDVVITIDDWWNGNVL